MHAGQGTAVDQQQSSQHGSVFSFLSPQICASIRYIYKKYNEFPTISVTSNFRTHAYGALNAVDKNN